MPRAHNSVPTSLGASGWAAVDGRSPAAAAPARRGLFDILNNNLTVPRIINYASTTANRDLCVSARATRYLFSPGAIFLQPFSE